jgi:hypothetical protein
MIGRKYVSGEFFRSVNITRGEFLLMYKELHREVPRVFNSQCLNILLKQRCSSELNVLSIEPFEEDDEHTFQSVLLCALNHKIQCKLERLVKWNGSFIKKYNTLEFEEINEHVNIKGLIKKSAYHCPFCLERHGFQWSVCREIESKVEKILTIQDILILDLKKYHKRIKDEEESREYNECELMRIEDRLSMAVRRREEVFEARRQRKLKQARHYTAMREQSLRLIMEDKMKAQAKKLVEDELAKRLKLKQLSDNLKNRNAVRRVCKFLESHCMYLIHNYRKNSERLRKYKRKREGLDLDEHIIRFSREKKPIPEGRFNNVYSTRLFRWIRESKREKEALAKFHEEEKVRLANKEKEELEGRFKIFKTERFKFSDDEDENIVTPKMKEPKKYPALDLAKLLSLYLKRKDTSQHCKVVLKRQSDVSFGNYYKLLSDYSQEWSHEDICAIIKYNRGTLGIEMPDDLGSYKKKD